jgi:hypothetical protein
MTIEQLFTRFGTEPVDPKMVFKGEGKPFIREQLKCSRCGGAGGADKWKNTGWTCFDCGGDGEGKIITVRVYTQAQKNVLDERLAKAHAKKQAKVDAAQAAARIEADKNRAAFLAEYAGLFARVDAYIAEVPVKIDDDGAPVRDLIRDIAASAREKAVMTSRMEEVLVDALDRYDARKIRDAAEAQRKATASHIGKIGDRVRKIEVEGVSFVDLSRKIDGMMAWKFLSILRTSDGSTIKVISGAFSAMRGDKLVITGSVKAHEVYKDEPQTVLQRVKIEEEIHRVPREHD